MAVNNIATIAIKIVVTTWPRPRSLSTPNTDMGATGAAGVNGDALIGHPEKWKDFGWRATHLMTTFSKALINAFYGDPASKSYFTGCSTGGQQALMEAQRFPYDYDGILAGAPAFNRTHIHTVTVAQYRATHATHGAPRPWLYGQSGCRQASATASRTARDFATDSSYS